MYPNFWGLSCAGHVSGSDTYEETVERELIEELNLKCKVSYIDKFLV
jgi:NADH pyrophosphatase NudC (nudix superfamily)